MNNISDFSKTLKNYYLVKKNIKTIDPTIFPNCIHADESLSIAKVIAEYGNQRAYFVCTPFRFSKDEEVFFASSVEIASKDNFNKHFLPIVDILPGMFKTNENLENIEFSHFNNHFNIGFGVPSNANKEALPIFYELDFNKVSSVKTNTNTTLQPEQLYKLIKSSQVDHFELFADVIDACKKEHKEKFNKREFETKAMNFFLLNRNKIKNYKILPAFMIVNKHKQLIDEFIENFSWVYLKEHLSEATVKVLNKMFLYEHYGLKTRKNKKPEPLKITLANAEKKEILLAYTELGKQVITDVLFTGRGEFEDYENKTKEIGEQYGAAQSALISCVQFQIQQLNELSASKNANKLNANELSKSKELDI